MEHITYLEISYPNFVLGQIIDPEEANQNNHDLQEKINDTVISHNAVIDKVKDLELRKATIIYVDEKMNSLAGVGRTTQTVKSNFDAIAAHKISGDHDNRYYTKTLLDSGQLDNRYYTKESLIPWLRGGDTNIKEEVFIITNSNNADGTFSYTSRGQMIVGTLTESGGQTFTLREGTYQANLNRIEVIINDTLRRSVVSGGIQELSPTQFVLTSPEGTGAEITVKYYERIGMTAEYSIKLSETKPPFNSGKTMWFEVI